MDLREDIAEIYGVLSRKAKTSDMALFYAIKSSDVSANIALARMQVNTELSNALVKSANLRKAK